MAGLQDKGCALRSSEGQEQLAVLASAYLQSYPTNGTILHRQDRMRSNSVSYV